MPARRPARHAALEPRRPRFALLRRRGVRATVAAVTASLTALAVMAVGAGVASAAPTPVYQITGAWAPGTPASTASGKLVTAVWRVNVNDLANPPANDNVPNVNFSVTATHGRFTAIPTPCKTTGVTPKSSISADGATLVCNLGTVKEGTAEVVQAPMVVNGQTGDEISATGTIAGQTADVPPIPISGTFGEDMLWGTPSSYHITTNATAPTNSEFDLEWTLRTRPGSDPGPNTVTYNLTVTQNPSSGPQRTLTVGAPDVPRAGCTTYTLGGYPAPGHPLSGRPDAPEMNAPFVTTCTLTRIDNTHYRLTLTGIDYSKTTLPTEDSARQPLPTNWDAVASGSIWFTLHGMTVPTGISLSASAPTYHSTTGQTFTDATSNNTSSKTLTLPGDWSTSWTRSFTRSGGTAWDNSYQVPQGTVVRSTISDYYGREATIPNNSIIAECDILDRKYVTFNAVTTTKNLHFGDTTLKPLAATIWYYTGAGDAARAKYLLPNNAAYDPNAFRGCSGNTGWTTTKPANGQILAVRATWPKSAVVNMDAHLQVDVTVAANAPIGQDVWTLGATRKGSTATWNYPGRQTDSGITPVPGSRYHYTTGARDVLHVTGPTPMISKSANPKVVTPGVPATFTLRYQMQGGPGLTFDNVRIVDTLPAGMTYVAGSGKPAPTTVSGQTLTWVLNGVPSNTPTNITYRASVAGVAAGQAVTNNVAMTAAGQTARASAQVTVATSGFTSILKTSDQQFIPNLTGDGSGTDSWTVTVTSNDPLPQPFTDTIDVLPYKGDGRGTDFHGSYTLNQITPPAGATVYYTTADPATLSDDPHDTTNGTPGSIAGNSVGWSTTYTPTATAIRIIGPRLNPGATLQFKVPITNSGAQAGDAYVNRAQGVAGHTQLVMRTSAAMTEAQHYAATIKKYVQDVNGVWHDANGAADFPAFHFGDVIHYKEVVKNVGQGTLTDFNITDDKQPQLGTFHIDSLASGQSQEHDYSITLGKSTNGTVVNNACATAATPPDMASAPKIGCDPAGFKVTNYITTKAADPDSGTPVAPGQTIKYTITVTQQGTEPADAQFSDDLSKILDDADYNNDVKADIGTAKFDAASKTLAWTGTVPVGGVAHVTYSVTVHDASALDKTGSDTDLLNPVTSPGCVPKDGQFPDCTTDHKTGYYTYSKVSDPKSGSDVGPKDTIKYTIVVVQHGEGAVTGAKVVDDMTKALDDAKYQKDAKASSGTVTYKAPKLFWTGDLAVGQQVDITYTMKVTGAGDEKLANVVTNPPGTPGFCDTSIGCKTHHQYGDYTFEKNSDPAPGSSVHPGDTISYTLTIMQHGPGAVADATVTDDMSQLLDDADFNNDAKASAGTLSYAAPKLIWKGHLAVGAKVTITYSVQVTGKGDQKLGNKVTDPTDPRGSCDTSGTCKTTHQITNPVAPAGTGGGGSLAFTGDNIQLQLVVIGLLLATGGLLVTVSLYRRRRNLG